MSLNALKKEINNIVHKTSGNVYVSIETPEGKFDINGDVKVRAASVIKVPILIEGYIQQEKGLLNLSDKMLVKESDIVGGGGVLRRLQAKLELTLHDLMELMIIVSDNTASNMLIDKFGFESINQTISDMGAKDTFLYNYFMLPKEGGPKNTTTANDMNRILKSINNKEFLSHESRQGIIDVMLGQKFKTRLPAYRKSHHEGITIAHKTGGLAGIRHDVGIISRKEQTVYASILTDDLSSGGEGQRRVASIGESIMDYIIRSK